SRSSMSPCFKAGVSSAMGILPKGQRQLNFRKMTNDQAPIHIRLVLHWSLRFGHSSFPCLLLDERKVAEHDRVQQRLAQQVVTFRQNTPLQQGQSGVGQVVDLAISNLENRLVPQAVLVL